MLQEPGAEIKYIFFHITLSQWGSTGREFPEEGTANAKAWKWEAEHPDFTHPLTADFVLAIVHSCHIIPYHIIYIIYHMLYQGYTEVIEQQSWEKLKDYPKSWLYRGGKRGHRARTQCLFSVEGRAALWVLAVRASVTLRKLDMASGKMVESLMVPDMGCIPGQHFIPHAPGWTDHYLAGPPLSLKSTLTICNSSPPPQRQAVFLIVLFCP